MELQVDIDGRVREWLKSMGYPVAGLPMEMLHGMLLREARQWQLSPEALCEMIDEGAEAHEEPRHRKRASGRSEVRLLEFLPASMFT